jgi:hypothetical protein
MFWWAWRHWRILRFIEHCSSIGRNGVQGCQMAFFETNNSDLGKFWRVLQWKMVVYYLAIRSIFRLYRILCGHLVYFMVIWYIFFRFVILYHEKSGSPGGFFLPCNCFLLLSNSFISIGFLFFQFKEKIFATKYQLQCYICMYVSQVLKMTRAGLQILINFNSVIS